MDGLSKKIIALVGEGCLAGWRAVGVRDGNGGRGDGIRGEDDGK